MREDKCLEFKENIQSNTFLKTISAFANYGTGEIIFGIDDDGIIKGVDNPEEACLSDYSTLVDHSFRLG
jgi:ATP-dependent DNA helicase RecG